MEQDRGRKACFVAVAPGSILDHLNLAIDAFSRRIGDRFAYVRDDVVEMTFDRKRRIQTVLFMRFFGRDDMVNIYR